MKKHRTLIFSKNIPLEVNQKDIIDRLICNMLKSIKITLHHMEYTR